MQIKFPALHDEELSSIEKNLTKHSLVPHSQLKSFVSQLRKIDRSLDIALKEEVFTPTSVERQKELVSKLSGRCHQLKERNDVIGFAEEAEQLANSSPKRNKEDIEKDAKLLKNRIDAFVKSHRPSRNNAKFIRFAQLLLDKAKKHEPVITPKEYHANVVSLDHYRTKDVTLKSYELAEALYELAHQLYKNDQEKFNRSLKEDFTLEMQKEIRFHVSKCKGILEKLSTKKDRMHIIQGILGLAHELTDYYLNNTPYPSAEEVHLTFEDLADVNHIEVEDLKPKPSV